MFTEYCRDYTSTQFNLQSAALMPTHLEAGHSPALSMTEAIMNQNGASGDVVVINGSKDGGINGDANDFANSEATNGSTPRRTGDDHDSREQHVNTKDNTSGQPAKSFDSEGKSDQASYEPIAIIGCGMRLPGAIDTDEALWQLLSGKQDGRCRVPLDRYNVDAFYAPGKAGHVCTEFG
jgi:hypothetical protein